jgi:hypothetical protein
MVVTTACNHVKATDDLTSIFLSIVANLVHSAFISTDVSNFFCCMDIFIRGSEWVNLICRGKYQFKNYVELQEYKAA